MLARHNSANCSIIVADEKKRDEKNNVNSNADKSFILFSSNIKQS